MPPCSIFHAVWDCVCARALVAQRMARTTTLALQALVALLCLTVVSGQFFVNLNDKNKVGAEEK